MPWLLLIAGLGVLILGADMLVRGASQLAARLGIPPLIIGLTVVAFGTSSPEVAVSLGAVTSGQPDLALGNAVGSNIFNVLFILGVSAVIRPLLVQVALIRIDVPIMIGASVALWLMLRDGVLGRGDGLILLLGIVGYMALAIRLARRGDPAAVIAPVTPTVAPTPAIAPRPGRWWVSVLLLLAGLGAAVIGARWFVAGAVDVARALQISEVVIGLTIVAAGTSMPEVATSILAAIKGQRDIAVGNVIGSNIFNILGILGLAGVVAPGGAPVTPSLMAFDVPVMIATALVCLPILFTGLEIRRWEGCVLLAGYLGYVGSLVLDATGHDALEGFTLVTLWFAIPLAGLGIGVSLVGAIRFRGSSPNPPG
jgi:cation:H+ antiporter